MVQTDAFWDKHAKGYAKRQIKDMAAYEQTLAHVRRHLKATDRAVELGCGTGSTALLLADAVERYTGTDISARMIEIAAAKPTVADNVRFERSDAAAPDLPEGGFDAVLAFNLLHLLPDVTVAARDARRLLKPGGLFITKTPCLAQGHRALRLLVLAMRAVGYAPFVNFLTDQGLRQAITGPGFEIVETELYPARSSSRFIVARRREDH
ncbi:class I SAM-dependent methyltransferase [Sedimentitalea nanhaiensis]|uniref:Methyltransferase domain-containing protein n=1 Tax=Sedimentitalea nanhaiensis TaxID=999627 RepID=A0A1I7E3P4_9RHOB|nr:class I SAM-dependent methyltransferase [Sedimentitalea nanhaiensis]SFU18539.1 Methyltransferase domain-containing protein [Sedimentitalea nanhaiensis]